VLIASFVVTEHQEEPGSTSFTHSFPIFTHMDKIPLSFIFSRLNR